jgi:tetratricopeptide (TPR) repeat protein
MLGETQEAISCHSMSEEISQGFLKSRNKNLEDELFKRLEIVSSFNRGLCRIDLREFDEAILHFERCISLAHQYNVESHTIEGFYCLAFLRSHSSSEQEKNLAYVLLNHYGENATAIYFQVLPTVN